MVMRTPTIAKVLIATIALTATPVLAQDVVALSFLRNIYETYRTSDKGLDFRSQAKAMRYFVPSLARLIARDSGAEGEVGVLDFDPFVEGQDWQADPNVEVDVSPGARADRAVGTLRLAADKPIAIRIDLQRTPAGWRISDIHWTDQQSSLVQMLSKER